MSKDAINQRFTDAVNYLISEESGLKKGQIAEKIGLKAAKFSEILNNRMNVGTDTLAMLCSHFNVSSEYILFGIGEISKLKNVKQEKNISPQEKPYSNKSEEDFESLIIKMLLESDKFKKGVVQILSEEAEDINEKKKKYLEELGDFWEKLQRDKSIKVSNKTAN